MNIKAASSVLLLGLVLSTLQGCQPKPIKKPNVLFIITDQQPLSCVGAYGNTQIKTPNIDRLAAGGVLFQNYYISAFACSPSRASMLSGRYAHNHNVFTNNVQMDPSIPTLGTILSEANYHTGYFGKAHLGGQMYVGRKGGDGIDFMHDTAPADPVGDDITQYWHYDRVESDSGWTVDKVNDGLGEDFPQLGFKEWAGGWRHYKDWLISQGQNEFAQIAGNHDDLQSAPEGEHMYSKLGEKYHMAAFFTEKTEAFIRKHSKDDRPWAAVLSFFGPHLPVAPPKPWDTLYALSEIPLPSNLYDSLIGKPNYQNQPQLQYVLGQWTEDQYKDYIRRYWGYSGYIDSQIGRVLTALEETGQWDNTVVVFTTDHGDMITSHGMIYKLGGNAYEELFHVPAIIRIPGLNSEGQSLSPLVASVDLLPTILEALNVPLPEKVDGKSLIPLMKQETDKHYPMVFSETHGVGVETKTIMGRDSRYKFVYHWLSHDVDELYDLQSDPGEMHNLYQNADHQQVVKRMREQIIQWANDTGHRYADLMAQKHLKTNYSK